MQDLMQNEITNNEKSRIGSTIVSVGIYRKESCWMMHPFIHGSMMNPSSLDENSSDDVQGVEKLPQNLIYCSFKLNKIRALNNM
jgi:hypothetical protein